MSAMLFGPLPRYLRRLLGSRTRWRVEIGQVEIEAEILGGKVDRFEREKCELVLAEGPMQSNGMPFAVDKGDIDWRVFKRLGSGKTAETCADNDDARTCSRVHGRGPSVTSSI